MPEDRYEQGEQTPMIEVRVFRNGELIHRELCESEEQASDLIEAWGELSGTTFEVDDLSVHHGGGEILEPEASEATEETFEHTTAERRREIYE